MRSDTIPFFSYHSSQVALSKGARHIDMLIAKVKATVRQYGMLSPGDRVVVAVSGGPDSICLLRALRDLSLHYGISLHVAHLDHQFRGEGSAADARFVEGLAKDLGLPATIGRRDVPAYCAERGLSAQAGAREVRYAFLKEIAGTIRADKVAVGHTMNDQAETFLMRIIRGAGMEGLSAIPPVRQDIIRPLIGVTRDEVLAYLREHGQDFVTDPSNLKPVYARNRIRQDVLPVLERVNPRIVETLAAEAALLRDEDSVIARALGDRLPTVLQRDGYSLRIDREAFNALPPALRRRALRHAVLLAAGEGSCGLSSVQTDEALAFMESALTGRALDLPGGLVLSREYHALVIRAREQEQEFCITLAVPGTTAVPGAFLSVECAVQDFLPAPDSDSGENNLWQAVFDYDKMNLPLYVRSRRPGDRFQPAGMGGGSKKLQDYFVDEKVPRTKRISIPLLATEKHVVWIMGMRTDGRFLPDAATEKVLVVTVQKVI